MKSKYEISLPVTVQYIIIKEDEVLEEGTSWRDKNKKPKSGKMIESHFLHIGLKAKDLT